MKLCCQQSELIIKETIEISSDEDEFFVAEKTTSVIVDGDLPNMKNIGAVPSLSAFNKNQNAYDNDLESVGLSDNDSTFSREMIVLSDFESKANKQQVEVQEHAHFDNGHTYEDSFNSYLPNDELQIDESDHSEVCHEMVNDLGESCTPDSTKRRLTISNNENNNNCDTDSQMESGMNYLSSMSKAKEFLLALKKDFDRELGNHEGGKPVLATLMSPFERRERSKSPIDNSTNEFDECSEDFTITEFDVPKQTKPTTSTDYKENQLTHIESARSKSIPIQRKRHSHSPGQSQENITQPLTNDWSIHEPYAKRKSKGTSFYSAIINRL